MNLRSGCYLIPCGKMTMTVNTMEGGRIISLTYDGYEFLTGKEINPDNYGATFWSSPQSFWGWPPPPVLDSSPYSLLENGDTIRIISGKDPLTGFQFEKEFSSGRNNWLNLTYTIINTTGEIRHAAPWEITRVHKGGLFFFPLGDGPIGKKQFEPVPAEIINGIVWYKDNGSRPETYQLSIADGSEGWIAYAIGGRIFIKKYHDSARQMQAQGEAEVLLYVSPEADYIEIEIQGTYEAIAPAERSAWDVAWTGVDIPPGISVEKGTKALVEYVRGIIQTARLAE